jgi:hypothetical protein
MQQDCQLTVMTSCTRNRTVSWRLWLPVHATGLSVDGYDFLYMQQDCQLTGMTSCTCNRTLSWQLWLPVQEGSLKQCKIVNWPTYGTEQCNCKSRSMFVPRLLSYFCSWRSIACYKKSNKGVTETARLQWKSAAQYYFTNFAPGGSEESYELSLLPATPPACLLMTSP